MADYMLMVLDDENAHALQSPKAMAELIEKRAQFEGGLRRGGQLRDSGRLRPSKEGKRIRRSGGRLNVEDGPFAEEGKALGGYYWVEARDVDEAARLAEGCATLASDEVDVRRVMKGRVVGDKETKPGKIFAFGVLANTPSEEAWVKVMDRIDADTNPLPIQGFLGGVRLDPPKTGKRVATQREKRATFDGPFLESKEVIGGLFLVRMTSMEEALQWAGETPFIAHGALEIRELWRS